MIIGAAVSSLLVYYAIFVGPACAGLHLQEPRPAFGCYCIRTGSRGPGSRTTIWVGQCAARGQSALLERRGGIKIIIHAQSKCRITSEKRIVSSGSGWTRPLCTDRIWLRLGVLARNQHEHAHATSKSRPLESRALQETLGSTILHGKERHPSAGCHILPLVRGRRTGAFFYNAYLTCSLLHCCIGSRWYGTWLSDRGA